jgi:ribosomal protein S18 acetylase RimI-like enzyme
MEISKGKVGDLAEIMRLISEVITDMWLHGLDQWDEDYPSREMIEDDLKTGSFYEAREGAELVGFIVLNDVQVEEYLKVKWLISGRILVVHRLAVRPKWQGKGLAKRLMVFAEGKAREGGYDAIRLDAYTVNPKATGLYEKLGYIKVGQLRYPRRKFDFNCYEKAM